MTKIKHRFKINNYFYILFKTHFIYFNYFDIFYKY